MTGRAFLAAMGMSEGRLGSRSERLYYDLAFLAGACGGHLPERDIREALAKARSPDERMRAIESENPLGDIFWELEAYADPSQTGRKIDWGAFGSVYSGAGSEYDRSHRDFSDLVGEKAPRINTGRCFEPDPEWTARKAEEMGTQIRGRLQPLLDKLGLPWPRRERSGSSTTHRYGR